MISVIVPIYNGQKYIRKCVKSILNQEYKELEVILVNDGSKDNSLKLCEEFAKKDSRIKVITQPNKGAVMARCTGVLSAEGEWITFLDVDDIFCNKKVLSKLMNTILLTNTEIIQFGNYHTYFYGMIKKKKTKAYLELDKNAFEKVYIDLFRGEPQYITPTVWGKMYPTDKLQEVIKDIDIRMNMGDDLYINNLYFEKYKPEKYVITDWPGVSHKIGIGISVDAANRVWSDYTKLKKLQVEIIKRNMLSDEYLYHTYVEYLYLLFYCAVQIYESSNDYRQLEHLVNTAFQLSDIKEAKSFLKETQYAKWQKIDEFCYLTSDEYCATVVNYVKNCTFKDKLKKRLRKMLYR